MIWPQLFVCICFCRRIQSL